MEITVKGLKTEYITEGNENGTPVLLLHGWGSSYDVYKGVIAALSDRCRLIALNFPGCGNTQVMPKPWSLDDYCDFVTEFLSLIGVKDPVIMGHSHGGRTALRLAASGRLNPPKMVLFDAAGIIPEKTFKQKARIKTFKVIKKVLTLPVIRNFSSGALNAARRHFGSADYNSAPPVLRQTMVSLVNTDLSSEISNISCPTLLIWGENDTDTPLACAKTMEKLIPDAGLCVIKGTGHFSFCERPAQTASILRSFIK